MLCQGWVMIMLAQPRGGTCGCHSRPGCFKFFVVRGWMVGEKKEDEASSVVAGLLFVALRLGLRVLALGLASG